MLDARLPPGSQAADGGHYLLNSDEQGRDLLSAILYGLRISLGVGVVSTLIAVTLGLLIGLLAAYKGGAGTGVIMRVVDIQLSFPAILIALILLAVLGQGIGKIIAAALVTVQWAYYAHEPCAVRRLPRKNKDYIAAGARLVSWTHCAASFTAKLPAAADRGGVRCRWRMR